MFKWKKTTDLDSKTFFNSWQAYVVLILAMGSMMFFGVCTPDGNRSIIPNDKAAAVDGVDIEAIDFRRAHVAMSSQMQQQYGSNFDPVALGVSRQVLNNLVDNLALYLEASKNGLYASDEEVEKIIIEGEYFKSEQVKFDPKLFENYLRSQAHTEKSFADELRRNLVANKLRNLITSTYRGSEKVAEINYLLDQTKLNVEFVRFDQSTVDVKVEAADIEKFLKEGGEEKVKEYFEKNKGEFEQEQKVRARHILFAYQGSRAAAGEGAQRSKEAAKAEAEKVWLETKGADFAKLAEKYTDEPSGKSKGGDLGFFRKDQMVKEFADVAFSLQPGQISQVVETPFGFHIIKVETVQEAKSVSLDQARNEIAQKIVSKERLPALLDAKVKATLAELKEGRAQDLAWKETGEFPLSARAIPGGLGPDPSLRKAIMSLKKPGDLYPEPLSLNGTSYFVRLKSRTEADISKLDAKAKEQLVESSRFMEAYGLYTTLAGEVRKKYEGSKKIYLNPEYLDYDAKLQGPAPGQG